MASIDDLADSELRRRLTQRGVSPESTEAMIQTREDPIHRAALADYLGLDE